MPLISVITVCFNSSHTIERTLKSVLEQDFKDYEYIIVDGGSTDGTLDIIRKYEPLFEGRMIWKSEPDNGIYDAFNKGIFRSSGIYCWNVNSDDYMEPHALGILAGYIGKYTEGKYPVISGAMNIRSEDNRIERIAVSSEKEAKRSYVMDDIGIKHPATLVPRYIYDITGVYDARFHIVGDMDWFQRSYKIGVPFLFIPDVITNMYNGGVSNLYTMKIYKYRCDDMRLLFEKKFNSKILRGIHYYRWKIRIILRFAKHKIFMGE